MTVNYAQGAAPIGEQPDTPELPLLTTAAEASLSTGSGGSPGLEATYFGTPDSTGPAVLTDVEDGANLNGGIPTRPWRRERPNARGGVIKINGWSVRYTGDVDAADHRAV